MSGSGYCYLCCIQTSQETGKGGPVLEASVRNPARDKVMRKEADIRKACSDFRGPSGNS